MEQKLRKLLSSEISREFETIPGLESGSKEQQIAINTVTTLYRLMMDDFKVESETKRLNAEHRLMLKKQRDELELRKRQLELDEAKCLDDKTNRICDKKDELKDRIFKWSISIAELILPLMFYAVWMKRGFEFERTGSYTSTTFRGLFNNFKPIKR